MCLGRFLEVVLYELDFTLFYFLFELDIKKIHLVNKYSPSTYFVPSIYSRHHVFSREQDRPNPHPVELLFNGMSRL